MKSLENVGPYGVFLFLLCLFIFLDNFLPVVYLYKEDFFGIFRNKITQL